MSSSPLVARFSRLRTAAIALSTLAIIGTGLIATPAANAATTTVSRTSVSSPTAATRAVGRFFPGGPGHPGQVWAGTWNNPEPSFCGDFLLHVPNHTGSPVVIKLYPGSTANSRVIFYLSELYSTTKDRERAAMVAFAIWKERGTKEAASYYAWAVATGKLTDSENKVILGLIKDATQADVAKLSITTASKALVGQKGSGTVKVTAASGKPVTGRLVTLSATNAKILTVNGRTGTQGLSTSTGLRFTFLRTNVGDPKFRAVHVAYSSSKAYFSHGSAGHQSTVGGKFSTTLVAYFSYHAVPGQPTITSVCSSNCDGTSTVTFAYCNAAGAQYINWYEHVSATLVATLKVAPGKCASVSAKVKDADVITTSYCYAGTAPAGACTTPVVKLPDTFEVVCPAWAQGTITLSCGCHPTDPAIVTLTAPAGSQRFYVGIVDIGNGVVTYQQDLPLGVPTVIKTGTLGHGTRIVASFTVYRDAAHTQLIESHVIQDVTVN